MSQYYKISRRLGTPHVNAVTVTVPLVGPVGPAGPQGEQGPPGEVSGSLAWDNVTDKPTTFPPSAHTHQASEIVDFTSAVEAVSPPADWDTLANKPSTFPPSSHGHVAAEISDFSTAAAAAAPVQSVAGKTGSVTLAKADVGLGNVDNTADLSKPVSTATQTALDGKAALSHTHTASQVTDFNTAAAAAAPVQSVNGNTGTVTVAVPSASTATPQALGTAAAGTSDDYSRGDHVHAAPALNDLSNVSAATPSDNDVLVFDTGTGNWVAEAAAGGGATTQTDIFTANGTWTKPAGAKKVHYLLIGGGGGGGSGRIGASGTQRSPGGGGGGGGLTIGWIDASALSSTESITIGSGGAGGASTIGSTDTDGNVGQNGGDTLFGSTLKAVGGKAGTAFNVGGAATANSTLIYGNLVALVAGESLNVGLSVKGGSGIASPAGGGAGRQIPTGGFNNTSGAGGDVGTTATGLYLGAPAAQIGEDGTAGIMAFNYCGTGGSGGSPPSSTFDGRKGGAGGNHGGGGGGGGAALNGAGGDNSGGSGGNGIAVITTYF